MQVEINIKGEEKNGMEKLPELTTSAVTLVTSVLGLFEVYPLNIILTFTLGGFAFKFFSKGRKAAGGHA